MSRKKRDRQRREKKLAKAEAARLQAGAAAIEKLAAERTPYGFSIAHESIQLQGRIDRFGAELIRQVLPPEGI